MTKTVDEILAPKPAARPRIYAYAIDDAASRRTVTMTKTIDQILAPKPVARPRIYAYAIDDAASGSANGATQAQPRATPWVGRAQHPFSPEGAT